MSKAPKVWTCFQDSGHGPAIPSQQPLQQLVPSGDIDDRLQKHGGCDCTRHNLALRLIPPKNQSAGPGNLQRLALGLQLAP